MMATIVNFDALWKIAAVGFGVGAGAVVVWSLAIIGASRIARARVQGEPVTTAGYGVLVGICCLAFAAALVAGFIPMTHK